MESRSFQPLAGRKPEFVAAHCLGRESELDIAPTDRVGIEFPTTRGFRIEFPASDRFRLTNNPTDCVPFNDGIRDVDFAIRTEAEYVAAG